MTPPRPAAGSLIEFGAGDWTCLATHLMPSGRKFLPLGALEGSSSDSLTIMTAPRARCRKSCIRAAAWRIRTFDARCAKSSKAFWRGASLLAHS